MVLNHFKLIPEVWTIFLSPHAPVEPNPPPSISPQNVLPFGCLVTASRYYSLPIILSI